MLWCIFLILFTCVLSKETLSCRRCSFKNCDIYFSEDYNSCDLELSIVNNDVFYFIPFKGSDGLMFSNSKFTTSFSIDKFMHPYGWNKISVNRATGSHYTMQIEFRQPNEIKVSNPNKIRINGPGIWAQGCGRQTTKNKLKALTSYLYNGIKLSITSVNPNYINIYSNCSRDFTSKIDSKHEVSWHHETSFKTVNYVETSSFTSSADRSLPTTVNAVPSSSSSAKNHTSSSNSSQFHTNVALISDVLILCVVVIICTLIIFKYRTEKNRHTKRYEINYYDSVASIKSEHLYDDPRDLYR